MKIGFDAKRAAQNRTGLGNYSRFVLRLLRRYAPEAECVLYVPQPRQAKHLAEVPGVEGCSVVSPRSWLGRLVPSVWRTAGLAQALRRDGVALYHGLSNELPLGIRRVGCRSVVTIHDVIFLHHPEYYKPIDRFIYRLKFRHAARVADCVVAVSEYTRSELVRWLGVPAEKIEVLYQGQQLDFAHVGEADRQAVRQRYGLPPRYILYVGTLEERKNLLLAARAMACLRRQGLLPEDMRLVAVGRATPYLDTLRRFLAAEGLSDRFLFLHNVSFDHLPACYLMADFMVYPSRIEGFGIPLLEAAAAGLPAIGCTGSSLEEAGGEGAFYVDPDDAQGMADCMLRLWRDEALRHTCSAKGLEYAGHFTDKALAEKLLDLYRRVLDA
ncbi:MAG: glycosyltransferase family 4 protein [Bacteroidales bacterium]|nr:glycosyltransferase family 4 protein [Bacteroidales bacterium]